MSNEVLLSNIMLNELDIELTKRGLRFVRFADDCNIYVKSIRAGQRVMESITGFIKAKLKLKVNQSKSKVDFCNKDIKFLGFGFYYSPRLKQIRVRVHPKSMKRLKEKLKKLTSRSWSVKLDYRIYKLKQTVVGWINYYKLADMKGLMETLDRLIRRIRACKWKSWKRITKRFNSLKRLIVKYKLNKTYEDAWALANTIKGIMHISQSLNYFIINKALAQKGLVSMSDYYKSRLILNTH